MIALMYFEGHLEQARRKFHLNIVTQIDLDIQGLGLVLPDHNANWLV